MKNIVVGLGEILWDVFPDRKVLGGAPANFAYHVSQCGLEGYVVSAVGEDALGDEILKSLDEKRLNRVIGTIECPTGTVQVTVDEAGVPQYEICEGVAWDFIPFSPEVEKLARQASAVCFGTLAQRSPVSRETIRRFLDLLPGSAYRIYDINLRQHFYSRDLIHQSLMRCNILKINDDEVRIVSGLYGWSDHSETEVCRRLMEKYCLRLVVLTKGAAGSYVFTDTETLFQETPKVEVKDTVGAGDSFTAVFVSALLQGRSAAEAHRLAVDVSAYVCTQQGAMPQLPDSLLKFVRR